MENYFDTICNIATSLTPSGIGIIRVSGPMSIKNVSEIFVTKNKKHINIETSHVVKYGFIYDKEKDEFIDEVLVTTMRSPKSYTMEDVVEINSHGGPLVLKKILNLLNKTTRLSLPGEFTKRAFLNGRIDLSKAEAIADIINAKNSLALSTSVKQLLGSVKETISSLRNKILDSMAFIEASLDDPEHLNLDGYKDILKNDVFNILNEINTLLSNSTKGKLIKEGINTCILGKPNVGKSSLLNILLNEERSIVSDIEGTTRDIIKESINFSGITLNIVDTAGIREGDINEIEKIGITRAKKEAENADLIILVLDKTRPIDNNDIELLNFIKNKKYIILLNKNDKVSSDFSFDFSFFEKNKIIDFSTKTKEGLSLLFDTITNMFISNEININNELFITTERHIEALNNTKQSLLNVIKSIENNLPEDFFTIDLKDAYSYLSQILGEEVGDDLINQIFSKFCMGK